MRIPRSYIENYSKALNLIGKRARAALADALGRIDYTADVSEIRDAIIAIMQPACGASSTMAARLAADFYDGLRVRFGVRDAFRAEVQTKRVPEATDGAVRAFVQDLVDGKPAEVLQAKCADRLDYETRRAANECIAYNAKRDPRKPKWARVPIGAETCPFCIMLASRGFAYQSEETASHAHAHCDCRVVPSWDRKNPAVEGYDPGLYYDMWKHPEKYENEESRDERIQRRIDDASIIGDGVYSMAASEIADEARRWDNELDEIIKHTPNIWDSKNAYRAYAKHVERKATNAAITIDDFTKIEGKELQAAQWFSNMGVEVHFRNHNREVNKSDVSMLGMLFDFKRVTSPSHPQISTVIKKKLKTQGPGFVVDLSMSPINLQDAMTECAYLLEKEQIERLLIIKDAQVIELRDRVANRGV